MDTPYIFTIRNQRVMLDFQLAPLYGIETKVLNQAARRNIERFDSDFMFQLESSELAGVRSQIVTLPQLTHLNLVATHAPLAFTELGVAMLSSVLRSPQAIQVNKGIMRSFFRMRSYLVLNQPLNERVDKLEEESMTVRQVFSEVFERLDTIEGTVVPLAPKRKKRIGLKPQ